MVTVCILNKLSSLSNQNKSIKTLYYIVIISFYILIQLLFILNVNIHYMLTVLFKIVSYLLSLLLKNSVLIIIDLCIYILIISIKCTDIVSMFKTITLLFDVTL